MLRIPQFGLIDAALSLHLSLFLSLLCSIPGSQHHPCPDPTPSWWTPNLGKEGKQDWEKDHPRPEKLPLERTPHNFYRSQSLTLQARRAPGSCYSASCYSGPVPGTVHPDERSPVACPPAAPAPSPWPQPQHWFPPSDPCVRYGHNLLEALTENCTPRLSQILSSSKVAYGQVGLNQLGSGCI